MEKKNAQVVIKKEKHIVGENRRRKGNGFGNKLYTDLCEVGKNETKRIQKTDLTAFALEVLEKTENLNDAMSVLLEKIGAACHLDRVLVMEVEEVYLSGTFPYQWARNPKDVLVEQKLYMDQKTFRRIFSEQESLSRICQGEQVRFMGSCLHAAVTAGSAYAGILSFERENPGDFWSAEEKTLIKNLSKIIGSFLTKSRADAMSHARMEFFSRMSHEIRTPMNAISGMTAIAKNKLNDRESVLSCLNKIEEANQSLLRMVDDIFDMTGAETDNAKLQYQPVELRDLLGGVERLLQLQARRKRIRFSVQNNYWQEQGILADSQKVSQMITDLVHNAFSLSDAGGHVCLGVRPIRSNEHSVTLEFTVHVGKPGEGEVTGQTSLFEDEWDRQEILSMEENPNVGISIPRRLIELMGGTLEIWKNREEGLLYYFALPFCLETQETDEAPEQGAEMQEQWGFQGKRILIVEDNEVNREIVETLLELHGLITESAVNGKEALDAFTAHPEYYYDSILMDIRMPVMDGLEATRQIRTSGRKDARSIPIIAVTGNSFDENAEKLIEKGMNGYLKKPINVEELLKVLAEKCKIEN